MGHLKKYLAWILAALCALMPVAGLAAENRDTQLTTTLPREHTITVVCGAGGAVRVEGTVYTGTRTFIVDRLSAFTLEAVPDAGYQFSQVEAQPSSGVSISGNMVIIGSVYEGKTLTLSFVREQVNPTPAVNPTPTISPTATASPTHTVSPTTTASPTATVSPTASPKPQPNFDLPFVESQRNVLYDDYLGTGSGLKELGILYDEDYELDEYELLAVLNNKDWADGNMLLAIAQPEDNGSYAQHSLMLSGLQLARLWQEKQIQWIEMRSGEAGVLLRIDELLSGNVAKYVDWALRDPEAAKPEAVENLPEVELTAVQLEHVRFEVRIEPGEEGTYRFGVYVWFAGEQPSVAELTSSLKVCLSAGEQGGEAERNAYVEAHALSATDEMGAVEYLESALIETPVRETGGQDQLSEYFNVEIDSEEHAIVLYDPEKSLDAYRRWSMCADWAGNVEYCLVELDG